MNPTLCHAYQSRNQRGISKRKNQNPQKTRQLLDSRHVCLIRWIPSSHEIIVFLIFKKETP